MIIIKRERDFSNHSSIVEQVLVLLHLVNMPVIIDTYGNRFINFMSDHIE